MLFNITSIFERNLDALFTPGKRIGINEGGTSSSKTYSIIQVLADISARRAKPLLTSIVSESMPHIKRGCMRDFRDIMGDDYDTDRWNATDHIYNFGAAQIEFFSVDDPGRVRGPRRDILFVNEANNIPKNTFDELYIRTRRFTFIDFNPVAEFWAHEMAKLQEVAWIHSTYLDAKHVLPAEIVKMIESRKGLDPNWWNIYGLGKVGNIEGLIHPNFTQIDSMPELCSGAIEFYGMDFGYTNDPTVLIHNIIINDNLYSDQVIFQTGLMNNQIADLMEQNKIKKGYDEIIADSAEPKSIDEIYQYGYNIRACVKGPDSVMAGIQKVNQYRQHWTKRSVESIKEQRNYRYIVDKNGKITNKPIEIWNHAMEARRQSVFTKITGDASPGVFVA